MINSLSKSLVFAGLLAVGTSALAQSGNLGTSGNSGNLGSAALGIDFFAGSVVAGSNQENDGGLASSLEAAFSGDAAGSGGEVQPTEAGKRRQ